MVVCPVTKNRSIAIPSFRMISEKNSGEFAGAFFRRPITLGREFTGEFTRDRFDRLISLEYREEQRKGGEKEIERERGGTRHEGSRLKSQLEIFPTYHVKFHRGPNESDFIFPAGARYFQKLGKPPKSQNRLCREIRLRFDFA